MLVDEQIKNARHNFMLASEEFGFEFVSPFNLTDEISMMITNAGRDSLTVCEYCGSRENIGVTMNYRYKTCCKHCWEEKILKYEPKSVWKQKL